MTCSEIQLTKFWTEIIIFIKYVTTLFCIQFALEALFNKLNTTLVLERNELEEEQSSCQSGCCLVTLFLADFAYWILEDVGYIRRN